MEGCYRGIYSRSGSVEQFTGFSSMSLYASGGEVGCSCGVKPVKCVPDCEQR